MTRNPPLVPLSPTSSPAESDPIYRSEGAEGLAASARQGLDGHLVASDDATNDQKMASALLRRTRMLERRLAMNSLWYLNTKVLGSDPQRIQVLQDPNVKQMIQESSQYVTKWMDLRDSDKLMPVGAKRKLVTPMKLLVCVPRRTGKSTNISEVVPVQAHLRDPDIAVGVSAATHSLAVKFADAIKSHWAADRDESRLTDLFGVYKPPHQSSGRAWSEGKVVTMARKDLARHDPTLSVFSVSTGSVGGHPDLVVLDDPITEEKLADGRQNWMEKSWTHYISLGYVLNPDSLFILVCTRYGEDDLVGQIIDKEIAPLVRALDLPNAPVGELPDDFHKNWDKYAKHAGWKVILRSCEFDLDGDPVDSMFPIAWTPAAIAMEKLKSATLAASQLNNRPALRDDNPVTEVHIRQMTIDRNEVPEEAYAFLTLHADWAWKDGKNYAKSRGDSNVLFACAHWKGNVYVVKGWRSNTATQKVCTDKFVEFLQWARDIKKFPGDPAGGRYRIFTMDKQPGGTTGDAVRNWFKSAAHDGSFRCPPIEELVRTKGKPDRLLAVAPFWTEPRLFLVDGVQGVREAGQQMCTINASAHDDEADALADAFEGCVYKPSKRRRSHAGGLGDGSLTNEEEREPYPWEVPYGADRGLGVGLRDFHSF